MNAPKGCSIAAMDKQFLAIDSELLKRLDALANAQGRPRDELAEAALRWFVECEERDMKAIEEGIRELDAGKFISHEDLMAELRARIAEKTRHAAE
jgi:predicted transcriptional regulator